MRYSKNRNAGIGHLNLTLGTRNVIWAFLFRFSFVSSASWLILGGVMSSRRQAAITLLRIVFSCDGWLWCAVLISRIRIICLHGFFFISWASSRAMDDCYMGRTHHLLQDELESTVHSMFTVPNVFGAWQRVQGSAISRGRPSRIEPTVERDPPLLEPPGWHSSPTCPSTGEVGPSLWVPPPAQLHSHIRHHCVCYPFFMILLVYTLTGRWTGLRALTFSVEVACAPGTICQQSAHKYAVPSTIFSVDLVIVLFRVDNTCHRSCDLVTHHTFCCI